VAKDKKSGTDNTNFEDKMAVDCFQCRDKVCDKHSSNASQCSKDESSKLLNPDSDPSVSSYMNQWSTERVRLRN
jgi:hypothetical protein